MIKHRKKLGNGDRTGSRAAALRSGPLRSRRNRERDVDDRGFRKRGRILRAEHPLFAIEEQILSLDWPLGTVVVTGPKTLDFNNAFCNHRATSLKADGKDILSVRMILNSWVDADANVAETNP